MVFRLCKSVNLEISFGIVGTTCHFSGRPLGSSDGEGHHDVLECLAGLEFLSVPQRMYPGSWLTILQSKP